MMVMVVMTTITMPMQCNGDVGDDAVRGGSCADTNHNIIYCPHLRTFCKHIQCFCQLLMDPKIGPTNQMLKKKLKKVEKKFDIMF